MVKLMRVKWYQAVFITLKAFILDNHCFLMIKPELDETQKNRVN